MKLILNPSELRALLTPPLLRLRGPREPLDLDKMTPNEFAGEIRDGNLRALLDDTNHAKAELDRANALVEERRNELEHLVAACVKLRPVLSANHVIERAGAQVLDVCRMFFLEAGSELWYEGIRTGLRELVSTLGVEVEDEQIEEHLKPQERLEPPPAAPAAEPLVLLTDADVPRFADAYHAALGPVEAVPPAGPSPTFRPEAWQSFARAVASTRDEGAANVLGDPACVHGVAFDCACSECGRSGFEGPAPAEARSSQCKHCGEEIRLDPTGADQDWIDAATHTRGEDDHKHEPAEDALGEEATVGEEIEF